MIFFGRKGDRRVSEITVSTEKELCEAVKSFLCSEKREEMLTSFRYYEGKNDILYRKRTVIGENGALVEDKNLSNNRIAHSFYKKLVDQKSEYLLGRDFTLESENGELLKEVEGVFDNALRGKIKSLCTEAVIKGIAWLQVYFEDGKIRFKKIKSEEILPVWADNDRTTLKNIIRVYPVGKGKERVEKWSLEGVETYILENGKLKAEKPLTTHFTINGKGYNFTTVPFIPFRYNELEIPLIRYTKSIIDDYDLLKSDDSNAITDQPNSILVVKNYDGQNLGEFRRNLSQFKAVKVTDDGGLDVKNTSLATDMIERHLALNRKDLYEAGRGVDTQSDDFKTASGVALKFLYADLDLDCNSIEREFLSAFDILMEFIVLWLKITGKGDFTGFKVDIIFNRDVIINETEAIENCVKSRGIISDKTVLKNHPWVKNITEEF